MLTEIPGDGEIYDPLTPIYPFNDPGQAIDLHSGQIGGLDVADAEGIIRLVPFPSPTIRWDISLRSTEYHHPAAARIGDWFDLSAGDMTGQAMTTSVSDGSASGTVPHLEFLSDAPLARVITHWMNLPNYMGNASLRHRTISSTSISRTRMNMYVDGWKITLDGHPRNSSLFEEDTGQARYVLTHTMELRREDGGTFDAERADRLLDALRLTLSFGAGRWVAPPLLVGFDATGTRAWERWTAPICDPFERIGTPTISPRIFGDVEALVTAGVASLGDAGRIGATGLQMQLAVQTAHLGMVENRIFSAFPALESLGWQLLVERGPVSRTAFNDSTKWPTSRRIREVLALAEVSATVEKEILPAIHELIETRKKVAELERVEGDEEKKIDGPDAIAWVRNTLVHGKAAKARLYERGPLVCEAWQLSREYVCLALLYAIGYSGGYLSSLPPPGFIGSPNPVPWQNKAQHGTSET